MPMTNKKGEPRKSELPKPVARSSAKARRTFAKTYDSAFDEYGSKSRAARVAYASLKRKYKKVGDRWKRRDKLGKGKKKAQKKKAQKK